MITFCYSCSEQIPRTKLHRNVNVVWGPVSMQYVRVWGPLRTHTCTWLCLVVILSKVGELYQQGGCIVRLSIICHLAELSMWQLTSLCCGHYYFSGSFTLAPRLLVTHTIVCNNPDAVLCDRFQSMNCKGWFISLTSCDEWTKSDHFPVFHNIVCVISSTIRERRVPPNNNSGIPPHNRIHILSRWRWGYERWKVVPVNSDLNSN